MTNRVLRRRRSRALATQVSSCNSSIRPQRSNLCKRCARIDLDAIFQKNHLTCRGNPVRFLGPVVKWSVDSCPLCHLMLQITQPKENGGPLVSHKLRSFSSKKISARGLQAINTVMLGIDFDHFLIKQSEDGQMVRIVQPLIDCKVISGWLQFCEDNHKSRCGAGSHSSGTNQPRSRFSTIPSFKLYDCEARDIVAGSNHQYIALSYVWGPGSGLSQYSPTLPHPMPATIEDAIKVTRDLGFRYLWVDRYCINQNNPDEVKEQVTQMDIIYSQAYLTIIAAAGEGADRGLPGVSQRLRNSQPHAMVGQHWLISTLGDPVSTIKSSKWNQRGWTYQEGLLSRRRLVFLDEQLYFECSGMYCCETLNCPLEDLHTQDNRHFKAEVCDGVNIGMFPKQIGASPWEVTQRIEEFTQRALSNPKDILNGIAGILRAFEASKGRVQHCLGVPIVSKPPKRSLKRKEDNGEIITLPYEWTQLTGLFIGLCWNVKSSSQRRAGFPSWSWAGWFGEVKWSLQEYEWPYVEKDKDFKARVQLQEGEIVDLETFCCTYSMMSSRISGTLHISAWVTRIEICKRNDWYKQSYEAVVMLEDKGPALWNFTPTSATDMRGESCIGIHLGHTIDGEPRRQKYLMVVREIDKGVYERVGFGGIDGDAETVSDYLSGQPHALSFWLPLPKLRRSWLEFQLR